MQVTDHYLRDVAKKRMMVEAITALDARNEKRAAAKRRAVLHVVSDLIFIQESFEYGFWVQLF